MLAAKGKKLGKVINLEKYAADGRLTEPSDGKIFDYRKMRNLVEKLGRPLTDKESEEFRIKWAASNGGFSHLLPDQTQNTRQKIHQTVRQGCHFT